MNIMLWILQTLLAVHTVMGAVWKLSNSEQGVPSLSALPHAVWLGMSGAEVLFAVGLLLPAVFKRLGITAPLAAAGVAAEMLLFSGLHLSSGETDFGPVAYWLVVAALCAFIVYGRLVLRPVKAAAVEKSSV